MCAHMQALVQLSNQEHREEQDVMCCCFLSADAVLCSKLLQLLAEPETMQDRCESVSRCLLADRQVHCGVIQWDHTSDCHSLVCECLHDIQMISAHACARAECCLRQLSTQHTHALRGYSMHRAPLCLPCMLQTIDQTISTWLCLAAPGFLISRFWRAGTAECT